ncbi:Crp/Fnr family transcriptional regulator [Peptococcus simiae]|uniref:Crp/Fnr family transcriptional regulator n=1 Tax=Peptococcus simiae TaxID=1643805 RepID=A0ABW9H035_9FIRM
MELTFLLDLPSACRYAFKKGDFLFLQGDAADCIYYLLEGSCERIAYSMDGNVIKYKEKSANDGVNSLVGINNLWMPDRTSHSSFKALSDIDCYRIDGEEVLAAVRTRPDILDALLRLQGDNYLHLTQLLNSHREKKIPAIFCSTLLEFAKEEDGAYRLPVTWKNAAICRMLGIHQVTAAKIMTYLRKHGIIERKDGIIFIKDIDALQTYADNKKMYY